MNLDKKKIYQELDEEVRKLLQNFWNKYPPNELGISTTGSVEYGHLEIGREGYMGNLTIKLNDEEMNDLITNGKVTITEDNFTHQSEYQNEPD